MFFFWRDFVIFQQRSWENFGNLCLFSANLTTFANFIVKFCQIFDTKRMRGKKKQLLKVETLQFKISPKIFMDNDFNQQV